MERILGPLCAALVIGAYLIAPAQQRILLSVLATAACGAATAVLVLRRRLLRSPWGWIAASFLMFVAGDLTYYAGPQVLPAALPDVLWHLGYVPLAVGLWRLVRSRSLSTLAEDLLDVGVVLGAAGVAIAFLVDSAPAETTAWDVVGTHTYTALNVLAVAAVVRLLARGGARLPSTRWLAAGAALLLGVDLAFSHLALAGLFVDGGLLDLVWPASYLCLVYALASASPLDAVGLRASAPSRSRARLLVVVGALLSVVLTGAPLGEPHAQRWATAGTVLAVLCIGGRMHLLRSSWVSAEEQVGRILQRAHDPYACIGLDGVVQEWNAAAERTFGYPAEAAVGLPLERLIIPAEERERYRTWLLQIRSGVPARVLERPVVLPAMAADGSPRSIEVVMWVVGNGPARRLHAHLRDVTARQHADEILRRQALQDPLTGLANRVLLSDRVDLALAAIRRTGGLAAILLVDLDDFKEVNETHGYVAGDELLVEAGQRIQRSVRETDTVARFGGDEFAVVATGLTDPADVERVAEAVLAALADGDPSIRASIGVATTDDADSLTELFACADLALIQVKRRGKGRSARYDAALHATSHRRARLRADLEQALDAGDLSVVYQPIVDLDDGAIVAAEALARWTHPQLGPVPPSEFVAVAEESGLIARLGAAVLDRACRDAAAWPDGPHGPIDVSVNVSATQLEPCFVDTVTAALDAAGLAADRLLLELTETTLIESVVQVAATMQRLRALGVRFAIDDFGTGYASLATLADLPVDCIKVDRQFIAMCTGDVHQHALAHAAVRLGQSLGLPVVAEGVETAEQHERLKEWACPRAQGYLHGRPMVADALGARLGSSEQAPAH